MGRKGKVCPSETFCIDKTILIILLCGIVFLLIFFNYIYRGYKENMFFDKHPIHSHYVNPSMPPLHNMTTMNSGPTTSLNGGDTYKDTYTPPLKPSSWYSGLRDYLYPSRELMLHNEGHNHKHIPVNVSTNYRGWREYRQVGILTRTDSKDQNRERETILALFGRPVHTSRAKWQYYTMTDKNKGIKLPMKSKGKDCGSSYGCDELFTGDIVHVKGFNETFEATIYDTESIEYIG